MVRNFLTFTQYTPLCVSERQKKAPEVTMELE